MSEELVIRQAAPTLAGIKTGSLFPCPCEDKAALLAEIRAFNRRYQARGLCLLPLRFTKGKALLYLYRPAALQRDLDSDAAAKLLAGGRISLRQLRRLRGGARAADAQLGGISARGRPVSQLPAGGREGFHRKPRGERQMHRRLEGVRRRAAGAADVCKI